MFNLDLNLEISRLAKRTLGFPPSHVIIQFRYQRAMDYGLIKPILIVIHAFIIRNEQSQRRLIGTIGAPAFYSLEFGQILRASRDCNGYLLPYVASSRAGLALIACAAE